MDPRIVRQSDQVDLDDEDLERIVDVLAWRSMPVFAAPGRTAWLVLERPARCRRTGVSLNVAKLKGVGHQSADGGPVPPSPVPHDCTTARPHVGFDDGGAYIHVTSAPAPLGGIRVTRAIAEHDHAERLGAAGVPAIVPLLVVEYADLPRFEGSPLGAVVTLAPAHTRASALLADDDDLPGRLRWVASQVGARLADFARAGLYRHASSLDNFGVTPGRTGLFLLDLDSSRPLDELAPTLRALQVLRDLASAVHNLVDELYYPPHAAWLGIDALLELDPIAALLASFFGAPAPGAAAAVWSYVLPHLLLIRRHQARFAGGDWDHARRQTYKVDRDLLYALVISAGRAPLAAAFPGLDADAHLTRDGLRDRARRFLGERATLIERLVAE